MSHTFKIKSKSKCFKTEHVELWVMGLEKKSSPCIGIADSQNKRNKAKEACTELLHMTLINLNTTMNNAWWLLMLPHISIIHHLSNSKRCYITFIIIILSLTFMPISLSLSLLRKWPNPLLILLSNQICVFIWLRIVYTTLGS